MHDRGLLAIISGPSGVGKTTISRAIAGRAPGQLSVSVTTRPRAGTDVDGVDYHFVDAAAFDRLRSNGQLLEWAEVFGHCYGTPRAEVEAALAAGKLVLLEIDVEGATQVKANLPSAYGLFVLPPDEQDLLVRLRARKRDDESVIQARFQWARAEIARARTCGVYDAFVVNDDLEQAIEQALGLIRSARGARGA